MACQEVRAKASKRYYCRPKNFRRVFGFSATFSATFSAHFSARFSAWTALLHMATIWHFKRAKCYLEGKILKNVTKPTAKSMCFCGFRIPIIKNHCQ